MQSSKQWDAELETIHEWQNIDQGCNLGELMASFLNAKPNAGLVQEKSIMKTTEVQTTETRRDPLAANFPGFENRENHVPWIYIYIYTYIYIYLEFRLF